LAVHTLDDAIPDIHSEGRIHPVARHAVTGQRHRTKPRRVA
jgi:hypothetical protein